MKNFHYVALTVALLLAPAFVLAEETGVSANTDASIRTEKPRPFIAPGQILKKIRENGENGRIDSEEIKSQVRAFVGIKTDEIKNRIASSTPEERRQMREEGHALIEQKKIEVRIKVEAAKEKAREKFGEAVQRSVGNIVDNLTRHIDKLGEIATRIDSRISELQSNGTTMSASATLLVAARADIAAAQDKVTAVGTALSSALASATPKAEMPKVRAAVKAAEEAIHTAKDSLKATLDSVRTATINQ